MNIVLKTGATSLLLRDALRRPLAEIELGEVDASVRRIDGNVTRVSFLVYLPALVIFENILIVAFKEMTLGLVLCRRTWEC